MKLIHVIKKHLTIFIVVSMLITVLAGCGNSTASVVDAPKTKIKVGLNAGDLVGQNYRNVYAQIVDKGFTNVTLLSTKDLVTGVIKKNGSVESVSINGDTSFTDSTYAYEDADIVIKYHQFDKKDKNGFKPKKNSNIVLAGLGFFIPNYYKEPLNLGTEIEYTAESGEGIAKLTLKSTKQDIVKQTFRGNDEVAAYILDDYLRTYIIGKKTRITIADQDAYQVKFIGQTEDADFNVIAYAIFNETADEVAVVSLQYNDETKYDYVPDFDKIITNAMLITEDTVQLTMNPKDFTKMTYEEAESTLRKMGFTNISANPEKDIKLVDVLKQDGKVDTITIEGEESFISGNWYLNDVEIVINYHSKK